MQIYLDKLGMISSEYPKKFYRVECWNFGRRIADFTNKSEAEIFAINHAKDNGYRYDHKVCEMSMIKR